MFLAGAAGRRWRRVALGLLAVSALPYVALQWRGDFLHGGSAWGLTYGIAGFALILLLAFFGVRKRWYRSVWGTLEGWLQAHIYLGLLLVVVVLFHTGLRFEDRLAVATFAVLVAVVASGLVGAFLYSLVPRLLTDAGSNRTAAEISGQLNQIAASMRRLAEGKSASFQRIAEGLLRRSAPPPLAGWRILLARRRRRDEAGSGDWRQLLGQVEQGEQEELRQLLVFARQHGELLDRLVAQQAYRNWLDAWLWVHLPLSAALLVLLTAHAVVALYYRGL